jgi:hypothetical protein
MHHLEWALWGMAISGTLLAIIGIVACLVLIFHRLK